MKILKAIIFWMASIISIIILTIAFAALIGAIQAKLFLPQKYIMWIFKYPISNLVFIYELYFIFGFIFKKNLGKFILGTKRKKSFIWKHKKPVLATFVILNIVLIYAILFDVTVISNNKIIDYTFLSPKGKEYSYNDIVKIDTGVYGKKNNLPFARFSTGDFYYIIELNDGIKINLTEVGGVIETDDVYNYDNDPHFIIEKLDRQFVNSGIFKVSSMNNFDYCTKYLDKIYTDKIRKILLN